MSDIRSHDSQIIEEFRTNSGRVGGFYNGTSLLLLTTTGKRSGKRNTTPLAYQTDGDRLILIGANIGATRNPDWYYNLVAHPQVTIEIGKDSFPAIASVLEGEERARFLDRARKAWAAGTEHLPELPQMPTDAERRIPVIALTLI